MLKAACDGLADEPLEMKPRIESEPLARGRLQQRSVVQNTIVLRDILVTGVVVVTRSFPVEVVFVVNKD